MSHLRHLRKKAICPNGEMLIVHTSNFRKVKRVQDVVKVFNEVRKTVPAKLLLVGDGPERSAIEKLAEQSCSMDDVRFLGKLEAVEEVLSVSDLFLMTSEKESFGLAALEAMAVGVPVVSTNTGGIPEVNEHGFSGYTSNVGDVEDMAKNAVYLLEDKERLATFKKNAVTQARKFNING